MILPVRARLLLTLLLAACLAAAGAARAAGPNEPAPGQESAADQYAGTTLNHPTSEDTTEGAPINPDGLPPTLAQLEDVPESTLGKTDKTGLPFDIRASALREAALSYGARGGLAWRTYQIRKSLESRAQSLDKVFDFRQLLIPAPSGMLIEPPVVSEEQKAMIIASTGTEAAVSDRVYDIAVQARLVGAPRSWRNYLERAWPTVKLPPDVLRPKDESERRKWIENVRTGWQMGIDQANQVFQDDLNMLTADYQGMIRYRMLLAQGIITPPYTTQTDRGITGGGKKMRVGDRDVQITGLPELLPGAQAWQPASQ